MSMLLFIMEPEVLHSDYESTLSHFPISSQQSYAREDSKGFSEHIVDSENQTVVVLWAHLHFVVWLNCCNVILTSSNFRTEKVEGKEDRSHRRAPVNHRASSAGRVGWKCAQAPRRQGKAPG